MDEGRKNYWEEKQEEDKETIVQLLLEFGIKMEDISLVGDLCVFPYKGRWVRIKIEGCLRATVYCFPEGSGYEDLIRTPFISDDADHRWEIVKEFLKTREFSEYGPREKAIKEILAVASPANNGGGAAPGPGL